MISEAVSKSTSMLSLSFLQALKIGRRRLEFYVISPQSPAPFFDTFKRKSVEMELRESEPYATGVA